MVVRAPIDGKKNIKTTKDKLIIFFLFTRDLPLKNALKWKLVDKPAANHI